ncbi:autophagy protein Apg12, putative [Cordyceps militaris CM01]|uniref:Ubiquitin-like protein ATG12 n=1 Tax=Cordyceps militaris (strain CM01) TaxID=983644 RepID=G3JDL6_CORMM|nr:autophagy protein Apg12, putative [Cordyceps militaris CM01]EGX92691.1 autophagy protein Apg12, putative [Cordyceps militaris CM01]
MGWSRRWDELFGLVFMARGGKQLANQRPLSSGLSEEKPWPLTDSSARLRPPLSPAMSSKAPTAPEQAAALRVGTSSPSISPSGGTSSLEDGDSPEDEEADIPLTMAASVVLADLPQSAAAALAASGAAAPPTERKVVVRFKAVGSAPPLAQDVCKISAARRFEEVVRYLRRKLRCRDTDSVFLYVNSAFAPSLDEVVGNLHQFVLGSYRVLTGVLWG